MSDRPSDLAGALRLWPGRQPALHSSRQDWVPRLAPGRPAAALPALLGSLFSLCAHAHRWTASRAVATAQGAALAEPAGERAQHRLSTLKEQMLRLAHDWPRQLPQAPQEPALAQGLRHCPLWQDSWPVAQRLAQLPGWLALHWLGMPAADWLADCRADPRDAPWHWAWRTDTPLARLLASQQASRALATPGASLALSATDLVALGEAMGQPGFVLHPTWHGAAPDTGPWSRQAQPLPHASAGERLAARLTEIVALACEQGEGWLAHGALALGPGEGLAWTEMARGLLVHRVRLEDGPQGPRVADARVLAPTEWNLHPEGTLARALQRLDPADHDGAARLAVAFDPCVPFQVETVPAGDNGGMSPVEEPSCTS